MGHWHKVLSGSHKRVKATAKIGWSRKWEVRWTRI